MCLCICLFIYLSVYFFIVELIKTPPKTTTTQNTVQRAQHLLHLEPNVIGGHDVDQLDRRGILHVWKYGDESEVDQAFERMHDYVS